MHRKQKILKIIAVLLIACIIGVTGYFIYDKTDFVKPSYIIAFDTNGGVCDTEELSFSRKEKVALPTPSKEGHEFLGWYYGDSKITDTSELREDITVKAKWKAKLFDITFVVDGVSKVVETEFGQYPEYGETPTKAPTMILEYEFVEWQPALEVVTEEATYTAVFEEKLLQYTVNYDANGGDCTETSVEAFPNQFLELPTPVREGYEFLGWYNGEDEWTDTTPVKSDMTLTAKWEILKFEITFVVNGTETTKVYNYGTFPNYGSEPTKASTNYADYIFQKWEPAITSVTKAQTYEAIFKEEIKYYTISVTSNYDEAFTLVGDGDCTYSETRVVEITNINPGYEFNGWFVGGSLYSEDLMLVFNSVVEDIYLYAEFTILEGTITYDLGVPGLTLENPNPTTYTVLDKTIELKLLDRVGYEMLGWYSGGTKYTTIDCADIKDYTFNAFWKIVTYKIEYELDGGTVLVQNPTTYTIENVDITLENPTRTDFEFVGWIGTDIDSPVKNVTIPTGSIGNRKYTAVWKSLLNTVSFTVDDTLLTADTMYLDSATATTEPTIDVAKYNMYGYEIDGWYTDEECTQPYTFGECLNADLRLYGKWNYFLAEGFYNSITKFKKASTSSTINIDSFEELIAYIDYVTFYDITAQNLIKLTYTSLTAQGLFNEFSKAANLMVFPRNARLGYLSTGSASHGSVYIKSSNLSVECTSVADPSKRNVCTQLDSANYINLASDRADNYDDFAINKVKKTLEVETSNQLVYALECGLNPVCKAGSKAESVYNKAKAVLREICDDDMSQIEKARAIYEWIIMTCEYDNAAVRNSNIMNNWWLYDSWFAEGVFNNGVAVCDGLAKAYLIMAKLEGIPTVRVSSDDHAWNKVNIDGEWYGIDTTHGNVIVNDTYEVLTYTSFMFTDEYKELSGDYAVNNRELVADTVFDYYSFADYDSTNTEIDLYVKSIDDLKLILNCFKNLSYSTEYLTIEIAVDASFTDFDEFDSGNYDGLSFSCQLASSFTDSSGYDVYVLYVA
ncbi:MAG: InlB B-repeat-containing protein [Clostridia bacterium]|nr:InlB B-repeat-containing protein [Clostridia bacterium]